MYKIVDPEITQRARHACSNGTDCLPLNDAGFLPLKKALAASAREGDVEPHFDRLLARHVFLQCTAPRETSIHCTS